MTRERTILHADLDAFYAAVEQRDDPDLRGKAVVIGGLGTRGVVSTASYEARRFGVRSAMPISTARRLAPHAVFIPPRMKAYVAVSRQVFEIFRSFTPLVEGLSLDEAFLDVGASARLFGSGEDIGRAIRAQVLEHTGLTISVGVAANKYVAKVASDLRKPDALVVVPRGEEAAFLAPLELKRLWGAGPGTVEKLERAGLATIGDLQRMPLAQLNRILGERAALHFHELAQGRDQRNVETEREAKSISRETTFARDEHRALELEKVLGRLARDVGSRLRKAGLRTRCIKLKLRLPDFQTFSRQRHLDPGTDRDAEILREARKLFRKLHQEGMPIRLIGVGTTDLQAAQEGEQLDLFTVEETSRARSLQDTLDQIRDRYGAGSILPGSDGCEEDD